jgi:hypothetical protein
VLDPLGIPPLGVVSAYRHGKVRTQSQQFLKCTLGGLALAELTERCNSHGVSVEKSWPLQNFVIRGLVFWSYYGQSGSYVFRFSAASDYVAPKSASGKFAGIDTDKRACGH